MGMAIPYILEKAAYDYKELNSTAVTIPRLRVSITLCDF
jgi:hypothetical protein